MTTTSGPLLDPERLAAVAATGLLDTGPEEPFDRLTRLAAQVLDAPYAFITVVDASRAFWKSCVGVERADIADRQNTVEESFCQYVVGTNGPLIVGDARLNPITKDNPSIESMGFIAWAGYPLRSADGHVVGTFCIFDTKPRDWTDRDATTLSALAAAASTEIELRTSLRATEDARRTLEAFSELAHRLASSATQIEAAAAILDVGRTLSGATGGSIRLLSDDGRTLDLVRAEGISERFVGRLGESIAISSQLACAQAYRTRQPVALRSRDEIFANLPATLRLIGDVPIEAFVTLPLCHEAVAFGVITLSFSDAAQLIHAETSIVTTLVRQSAQALARARLHEAEQRARTSLEHLQAATAGLSQAATMREVAAVAVTHSVAALGAARGTLSLLSEDGRTVEIVASHGYDNDHIEPWRPYSVDTDAPDLLALCVGAPRLFNSAEEIGNHCPWVGPNIDASGDQAWAALPLASSTRTFGVLVLGLREWRRVTRTERMLMTTIADQTGMALERARLHMLVEQSGRRAAFVNIAIGGIDSAQGERERAAILAQVLVPDLADYASVELNRPDGARVVAAVAHHDPLMITPLHAHRQRSVRNGDASRGLARAMHTMRPELLSHTTPGLIAAQMDDAGGPGVLRRLEPTSCIFMPLVAAGRSTGGLLLARCGGREPLSEADLATAQELATHAALALENARLYEEEHHIAQTLQRSLLPGVLPEVDGIQLAASYLPAGDVNEVGGDFFDVFATSGGWIAMVGDVCGKGPEAAKLTALCRYTIRAATLVDDDAPPSGLVALLNRAILANSPDLDFCTIAVVRFRHAGPGIVQATCSVAAHPPILVARSNGRVDSITSFGGLVGVSPDTTYGDVDVELGAGDSLLLYTDGLTEARARRGHFFGESRLSRLLVDSLCASATDTIEAIERELAAFQDGAPLRDDVAVLAVRVAPSHVQAPVATPLDRDAALRCFRRTISMDPQHLAPLRSSLRAWLDDLAMKRGMVDDVVLACNEACANAIEHANGAHDGTINVSAEMDQAEIVVTVRDDGSWREVPAQGNRGRGLAIIRAVMDDVAIDRTAWGTTLIMRRAVADLVRAAT